MSNFSFEWPTNIPYTLSHIETILYCAAVAGENTVAVDINKTEDFHTCEKFAKIYDLKFELCRIPSRSNQTFEFKFIFPEQQTQNNKILELYEH